jgi:importin subunit alpha-1
VSKELLQTAQENHWIPLLLSWLNLHDRPAVQVEALLSLTHIAELCAAQQAYFPGTNVVKAAQAAVNAVQGSSWNDAMEVAQKYAGSAAYTYNAPGSVPFPPLSFSQTLSSEAVAALDASLTYTLQEHGNILKRNNPNWSLPPAPLFPSAPPAAPGTGGINFTSLAPPPGGAHSSVPQNAFLPPPTPVAAVGGAGLNFPQQLSASCQHLLLRHADAIPTLISLLSSPNREVYEQAMWILGSIAAGDATTAAAAAAAAADNEKTVSARDVILAAGVMNQLIRCLEGHPQNLSLQRIGSWTLSNLVDGIFQTGSSHKSGSSSASGSHGNATAGGGATANNNTAKSEYSSADEIDMTTLLPILRRLLQSSDSEVLSYTCWTLSHLCDGPASHIAAVVTTPPKSKVAPKGGLVPRLVELLMHLSWRVTKPALRTIGNIVCAECSDDSGIGVTTDYTEVILDCNAVPRLKELITHSNREIQKEACWTLSNIAAGTVDQIQAVIDSGAIPPLVNLVQHKKTDQEVRSEACWVVLNATSCGSDSQIEVLVDEGCVAVLGVLLSEASMVMMALEGLERVLQVEETREMIRREQIESGDLDEDDEAGKTPTLVSASLIEKAREGHHSGTVTKRADRIWKQHFVSCALCKMAFSKHRTADASFCEECKCHVCSNCNCRIYHLDYQEELWAATEEKTEAQKKAKKSKNKKKKEKLKQKKAQQLKPEVKDTSKTEANSTSVAKSAESAVEITQSKDSAVAAKKGTVTKTTLPTASFEEEDEDEEAPQTQIDLVLYLQQTGSIIALAKLMDALEYGGEDYDEELDDYERKMIREQQILRRTAT